MMFQKIKYAECDLQDFELEKKHQRKPRIANNYYNYFCWENSEYQLYEGLNLYSYSKFNKKINLKKLIDFYFSNKSNVLIILAKYEEEIVGFMSGIIIEKKIFMIQHFYNPKYTIHYMNDGLYHFFINRSLELGMEIIDWGSIEIEDYGLEKMKKKYSSKINIRAILSFI